jgi:signal transduction histidine kinase/CheY-like chemotaxis protein
MQYTPYTASTFLSGVVAASAAVVAFRRRRQTPAAVEFARAATAIAMMCFTYVGELGAATLENKLVWLNVRYIGICPTPLLTMLLALRWSEYDAWLSRRRIVLLCIIPLLTVGFAWTNELHHLVAGPSVLVQRNGYVLRQADSRIVFWIFLAHAYLCLLVAVGTYVRKTLSSPPHRQQGAILLLATLLPWAANVLYLFFGNAIDRGYDVSHVGYAASCVVWTVALTKWRLFYVVPVARDRVFESLNDAVLVVDRAGHILDHNPSAQRLFDRATPFVGINISSLMGEALAARLQEERVVSLLGHVFEVDRSDVRHSQRADASVLIFRNVTDRRRMEAAREEARRAAEEASQARAQFLARMSHEVRSPLHGVVGAADILLTSELDPKTRRYAEALATSARVLLALVDELLDFSKLEADRLSIELADVDAREIVEEVALLFAGTTEKKGLKLSIDAPPRIPIRADRVRLRQVLVNLVGNAVKFTDAGEITIAVQRSGDVQRFEVRDTGIGIAEAAHEQIFEPFVQVRATPREGPAGTGLGLSIARRMTELMGGHMGVESAVGKGSRFWFTLQALDDAEREARPETPHEYGQRRQGRVLLVEDNEVNRLVTCGLLEREGCEVEVVGSGPEALAHLSRESFALVLTDVRMGGMTGHELAAEVRRLPGAAGRTAIVALTADVHDGARQQALEAGMDDWLAKPTDPALLRRVLDRWVPRVSAAAQADLRGYFSADPALYDRIVDAFRRTAPMDVAAVLDAARRSDDAAVHDRAHSLKGAGLLVGAGELAAVCERLCRGTTDDRAVALSLLEVTAARAVEAFTTTASRAA